jgi:CRISPR-associated protein Cas5t
MDVSVYVEVPFCAFRPYTSREYQDTYPVPSPSAVYGMLLSLVGVPRDNKAIHCGVEMVLAVEQLPARAKVFRKLRRVPQAQKNPKENELRHTRPDYQDLLLDLRFWVWLRHGRDAAPVPLADRVVQALSFPTSITRFGGLSLGESSYLVDTIVVKEPTDREGVFLQPDSQGFHSLPIWVDHQDALRTRLQRFSLVSRSLRDELQGYWVEIPLPAG